MPKMLQSMIYTSLLHPGDIHDVKCSSPIFASFEACINTLNLVVSVHVITFLTLILIHIVKRGLSE